MDGVVKATNLNLSDAPSGSPVHCCHAPFEVICRSIRIRFREEMGIDPRISL